MKKEENEVVVKQQAAPTEAQAAEALKGQYRIVVAAERATNRQRAKLGCMLIEWERFLGEGRGGRGGTSKGMGLKGWLEKNMPELGYSAALGYKDVARRAIEMLGGGAMAVAALLDNTTITQPNGEAIDVDHTVIKNCDELFEQADSRRKFEQMWLSFAKNTNGNAKGANGQGNGTIPTLSQEEAAQVIWVRLMVSLDKGTVLTSIPLLPGKVAQTCFDRLTTLRDALKARLDEEAV